MQRYVISTILIAILHVGHAQELPDLQEKFESDIDSYFQAINNGKWQVALDLMYPPIFELASKEQMIAQFDELELIGMQMHTNLIAINNITNKFSHQQNQFCIFNYHAIITVTLKGQLLQSKDDIQTGFEMDYGTENVTVVDNVFTIDAKKAMMAIFYKKDSWKYLEFDPSKSTNSQIIPIEVLEHFKIE